MYLTVLSGFFLLRYAADNRLVSIQGAYWFTLLGVFLFSAYRFEVGCDWTGYLNQYYEYAFIRFADLAEQSEPLWVSLFMLQNWLGLDYPWINVFSSLIFFAGVHVIARRQPNPLAYLVLLFPVLIINMPMSGIRQGAAIGVMFIAFMAFADRALIRFIVLTLVAAGFHPSALLFLLLAPLVTGKYSRDRLLLAAILALPGALLIADGEAVDTANYRYIDTDANAAGGLFRIGVLGFSALYFLWFLRRKWQRLFPADFKLAMIGSLMMLGTFAILPVSGVIADRLAYYLIPIQALIFARIPYFHWRSDRTLHVVFPYALLLLMFAVWTYFSYHFQLCYVPYKTWLFGYPEMSKALF